MLLISQISENQEGVIAGLEKRNIKNAEALINEVLDVDKERRTSQMVLDNTLAEINTNSRQIGQLMKEGKADEATAIKERTKDLKEESKKMTESLGVLEDRLTQLLYNIPNIPNEKVPQGHSEEHNEIVHEWGETPVLGENNSPHWELIKKYDIIDFDLGNKITGAGFPVYKGKGARLQRSLINFFLDKGRDAGYIEIQPPILINEASGYGTGQLPDKEGQMYHATADDLYLIPTAEVPITNIYRDQILDETDLPIKNVGFTPCFRREAGSWGAHVRGLNRLHQFDKVEIVQIAKPEDSYTILEEMRSHVQGLIEQLGLKYRTLVLCGGDIGFTSALTYDMEVYSAAQDKWLEVSSVSNFETYQANRLKLRYRKPDKKKQLLHTLNGSALALPRIMAAIIENNQTEDGIRVPDVLVPYTGFEVID